MDGDHRRGRIRISLLSQARQSIDRMEQSLSSVLGVGVADLIVSGLKLDLADFVDILLKPLLKQYGAPHCLFNYWTWVFKDRTTVPKIPNHLAWPVTPRVGLDMGRACSVLLFCLSVDPLVRQVNALQLPILRAYMDDTTLAKLGTKWIKPVQQSFLLYEKVGIVADQHVCCSFGCHFQSSPNMTKIYFTDICFSSVHFFKPQMLYISSNLKWQNILNRTHVFFFRTNT